MQHVLITGGNFLNQGAYLMLVAAAQGIRDYMGATPVVSVRQGTPRQKASLGLDTLMAEEKLALFPALGSRNRGRYLRDRLPFVTVADVDAVIDVSGFTFGDQWVNGPLARRSRAFQALASRNKLIYMLPQAFGPFNETAEVTKSAVNVAEIVYAREPTSLEFIQSLFPDQTKPVLKEAPDFTALVKGTSTDLSRNLAGSVAIVPNWNISARAGSDVATQAYISNMVAVVNHLTRRGISCYGLCHEGKKDLQLLQEVKSQVADFPIYAGLNGLELKGILGTAVAVVSGRYHATVSAISQGVPTLIHGWSHKYDELATQYDVGEFVLDPYASTAQHCTMVDNLVEYSDKNKLLHSADGVKRENTKMWVDIATDFEAKVTR